MIDAGSIDLVTGGLILIMIAWVIQLYSLIKYGNDIRPSFAALFSGGVLMLLLSELEHGFFSYNFLVNLVSLGSAAVMFLLLLKNK